MAHMTDPVADPAGADDLELDPELASALFCDEPPDGLFSMALERAFAADPLEADIGLLPAEQVAAEADPVDHAADLVDDPHQEPHDDLDDPPAVDLPEDDPEFGPVGFDHHLDHGQHLPDPAPEPGHLDLPDPGPDFPAG